MADQERGLIAMLAALACIACACEGARGPSGPMGLGGGDGGAGLPGTTGPGGTTGLDAGATAGLNALVSISSPANGAYFTAGERPVVTISFSNALGRVAVSELGTAWLFAYGPRVGSLTRTASSLLNCVTDRAASQHHAIDLAAPSYADPSAANLSVGADGALTYTFNAVSSELPGTYAVGVWAKSADDRDQTFPLVDFQLGTAAVETYASGPTAQASCFACHLGRQSGKSYEAHIIPSDFSLVGDYALDSEPIASCEACHNNDGFSENPLVRKVHGAHRGRDLTAPGVAHPEYGLGQDPSLAHFTDVVFPSLPGNEKDCAACHVDDRWKNLPGQKACGTCHDDVFFDSGTVSPPKVLGPPSGGPCTTDQSCSTVSSLGVCNVGTGNCELHTHPKQAGDAQCSTCHPPETSGLSPIALAHAISSRTASNLETASVALDGGSGSGGSFLVGDIPVLTFKLTDAQGTVVSTLSTDPSLQATVVVGGPTNDRQRIVGSLNMKSTGTLGFDVGSGVYTYVFPTGLPAAPLPPLNAGLALARPTNPPGTYSLWAWISRGTDVANATVDFSFEDATPLAPRQVIAQAACEACHVQLQAHGGSRREAQSCSLCHTGGAVDRTVGALGLSCTTDVTCPGFAAGWEACEDSLGGACTGVGCTCTITVDPTPGRTIDFRAMIHDIHFARLREGFAETGLFPGKLDFVGFRNGVTDFSSVLLPVDVRNCTQCHADSAATCSATAPCGVGQLCQAGSCINTSWLAPSGTVCLSCHDSASTFAHAMTNTLTDGGTQIESCTVCHGPGTAFAVDQVHALVDPYRPPYSREPAP